MVMPCRAGRRRGGDPGDGGREPARAAVAAAGAAGVRPGQQARPLGRARTRPPGPALAALCWGLVTLLELPPKAHVAGTFPTTSGGTS